MVEYIDKSVVNALRDMAMASAKEYAGLMVAADYVENMPSADVEPVKHGHWIVTEYYNPSEFGEEKAYTFECSECGNAYQSTLGKMDKCKCEIRAIGCHDATTDIFYLTEEKFEFLDNIFSQLNEKSEYECMPCVYISRESDEGESNDEL